tara:strand:+ start:149 stop:355 length:207 start_codon:yes stop_codon:yes gene_type:complete
MTKDEMECFVRIITVVDKKKRITSGQRRELGVLYKNLFGDDAQWSNCGKCNEKTIDNLRKVFAKSCDV